MLQEQTVHIRVDEAFKGVSKGETIVLHQGGTDCDAKFSTGQRSVFYLSGGPPNNWRVPSCTRALAEPDGDDVLFLRGLPDSAKGTRLSGEVELYEDSRTQAFRRVGGIPDVNVKITGPEGFTRQVKTNSTGVYEVFGVPPGQYSVRIDVPKDLKLKFPVASGSSVILHDEAAVQLAPNGGASIDFVLQANTRVSGRMLDSNGKPLANICIDLEPVEGRGKNGARFFDCSKKGGTFTMQMMPPGEYLLVARDPIKLGALKSDSTLYYPGVRDRAQAATITVEPLNYVQDLNIRLPSSEQRYTITGRFQYADGVPIAGANVTFASQAHGYSEHTETSSDGSFGLRVIAGFEGELKGTTFVIQSLLPSCPGFHVRPTPSGFMRFMDADAIPLKIDSDHPGVLLELPFPSCPSWPKPRNAIQR